VPGSTGGNYQVACSNVCTGKLVIEMCTFGDADCYDFSPVVCAAYTGGCTGATPPPAPPIVVQKSVACNVCGQIELVKCDSTDPSCVNYNVAVCGVPDCSGGGGTPPLPDRDNSGGSYIPGAGSALSTCPDKQDACAQKGAKFASLTFLWTGNIYGDMHAQGEYNKKVKLQSERVPDGARLRVRAMGSTFPEVPTVPKVGDVFTISATDLGKRSLKAVTKFKVAQKAVYQFVTNCKNPVRINDEFGPFKIIGWTLNKNTAKFRDSQCPIKDSSAGLSQDETDNFGYGSSAAAASGSKSNGGSSGVSAGAAASMAIMALMIVAAVAGLFYMHNQKKDGPQQQVMYGDAPATNSETSE
jgi:hypothetical protein